MVRIKRPLDILAYAVALLGAAPLFPFLDLPVQAILAVALVAAVFLDGREFYPLKSRPATLFSLACFAIYAAGAGRENLVGPAINTLALLLAVRLLTEKTGRNYLQIFVLALFALAGSSLLSLSPVFFLYLVLQVVFVTTGLVLLSFHAVDTRLALQRGQLGKIFATALILPAISLVLMLAFFLILPRTRHPLWNFLNPAATAETGISDQVRPGTFAGIAEATEVAFRVHCPKLGNNELYWRGVVLNTLEGTTWVRKEAPAGETARPAGGRQVAQTFFPEPKRDRYLFALDPPLSLEGIGAARSADRVFTAVRDINRRVKYEVVSSAGGNLVTDGKIDRDFYLRVPVSPSARVREAAAGIAALGKTEREKISLLEDFFAAQGLAYANTDLAGTADPVDDFLFGKKRGYCEFFASSFAVMLRLAGVPARLVGGYYGGEYNDLGGYYLVTNAAAHVWVEALEGGQWIRIDPSRLAQNAAADLIASRSRNLGTVRKLLDAADHLWNRAVITYDLDQQMGALRQADRMLRGVRFSLPWRKVLVAALLLAAAVGMGLVARSARISREERMVRKFLRRVAHRYGPEAVRDRPGLRELAERLGDPVCREFADIYGGAVYRDRKLDRGEIGRLARIIRRVGSEAKR